MGLLVTADDITAALTRLDRVYDNLDAAAAACPALSALARAQWVKTRDDFRKFSADNKGHGFFALGLPAIGDQTVQYEKESNAWTARLEAVCPHVAPPLAPSHDEIAKANADASTPRLPSVDASTKLLLGGGLAVALLLLLRR